MKKLTVEEHEWLLLQFIGSLTLCDHMGDVSNDVMEVLRRIGMNEIEWDDMSDLGSAFGELGITTLYDTSLADEEGAAEDEK